MSATRLAARLEMLGLNSIAHSVERGADRFRLFALLALTDCCPNTFDLAYGWIEEAKL